MNYLAQAHNLKKQLDELRPISTEQEQKILAKFRLDWNFHSNNLEGNSLNFGETKMLLLHGITSSGKPLKDHLEIEGHNEALNLIEEVIKSNRPLTQNFIRELHKIILKNPYQVDAITPDNKPTKKLIKVGKYKTLPNHVKTIAGEIFYFSTPEETPARMSDLINWYENEVSKKDFDPVLTASIFHYKFIRIHPFDDGNGRIARILLNFILMQFHFPPVIIKTQDKENYFRALRQADGGFLDQFVEYIAKNLCHSLEIMIKGAKGEEIEDEDYLDKEIAVLKATYKATKNNKKEYKTTENIQKLAKNSLKKLFEEFIKACEKFDEFYKKADFFSVCKTIFSDESYFEDKRKFIDFLTSKKCDDNLKEILLRYRFQDNEEYNTELAIEFEKEKFVISTTSYGTKTNFVENKIEKTYQEQLTDEEITEIINSEKKRHLGILKKQKL